MDPTGRTAGRRWPDRIRMAARRRRGMGLAALLVFTGVGAARAEQSILDVFLPPVAIGEALAEPYGRVLQAEFGSILFQSADGECLRAKSLDRAKLDALASDLLIRYGEKALAASRQLLDEKAIEAEFNRRAGPKALGEFRRLTNDRATQVYRKHQHEARLDTAADNVVDQLNTYLVVKRFHLEGSPSPTAAGRADLLALNRAEAEPPSVDALTRNRRDRAKLNRLLDLNDHFLAAMKATIAKNSASLATGASPYKAFQGIERELEDACIAVTAKAEPKPDQARPAGN